jgi:hypothetical protein
MKTKHILLSAVFSIMIVSAFGQSSDDIKGSYQFTQSINDTLMQQTGISIFGVPIHYGHKVVVQYVKDDKVYYKYWIFANETLGAKYNQKVFNMPVDVFKQVSIPLYKRFKGVKVGAYTIPVRLRGIGTSDFDFEANFSASTNLAFGYGSRTKKESWLDTSVGLGITSVNLTNLNSNVLTARTAAAFTLVFGSVIKFNPAANCGLFFGFDFLGKTDRPTNWQYNGKPWLGLGINITFTEIKTDARASVSKN